MNILTQVVARLAQALILLRLINNRFGDQDVLSFFAILLCILGADWITNRTIKFLGTRLKKQSEDGRPTVGSL
jgi:hypothetical protein